MTKKRTSLLVLVAALAVFASIAPAQSYPTKPIRMVVAQAAGGPTDVVTRIFSSKLSELLGQQIVVDNRPGAGGSVAGEVVAHAPADGYTLCVMANGTAAVAPHFIKLNYSVEKDFAPVALIGNSPLALMVSTAMPTHSVKELISLAKERPGTINFGSSGQGSTGQLAGELFKIMAAVELTHVPYKGAAPALVALVTGEIQMLVSAFSSSLTYIKQGRVRALAVTGTKRQRVFPDLPTVAETLPGYEATSWYALLTRAGTPRAIIERLNREATRALTDPDMRWKLVGAGVDVEILTPEALGAKIRADYERWGKVVKATGMKAQ
ncbi:MAG TPA: tripartite tricarboxylate transporter substrate binding protein [Burkholderiales bacterium]|nr:tripartite tricarboxylate transporter substrate binding protein [Burkholderiales bacterium]